MNKLYYTNKNLDKASIESLDGRLVKVRDLELLLDNYNPDGYRQIDVPVIESELADIARQLALDLELISDYVENLRREHGY